jgi:hypothetical protein
MPSLEIIALPLPFFFFFFKGGGILKHGPECSFCIFPPCAYYQLITFEVFSDFESLSGSGSYYILSVISSFRELISVSGWLEVGS